jgi:hypothetical protein
VGVRGRSLAALLCTAAALAAAQAAGANRTHPSATDQARANQAVLKLDDLPSVIEWQPNHIGGGSANPIGSGFSCAGYAPKTSDLVTTAEATRDFIAPGIGLESDVTMLASARMVRLNWSRTFTPALGPCLAKTFVKELGDSIRNVTVRRLPFPPLGEHAALYRMVYEVPSAGKGAHGLTDVVVVVGGRVQISLLLVAAFGSPAELKSARAGLSALERQLATTVSGRLVAPVA